MLKKSTCLVLGALFLGGCSSPQSKAKDADAAQHDADEKSAQAREDGKIKSDAVEAKADKDHAANERDVARKGAEAQNEADGKAAEATASLAKARIEARNDNEQKLAGLEKQFAELKPKLVRKLSKADSTTVVNDLVAKSDAVRRSIRDLDSATADSLEPVKSTIAQRLIDFNQAIDEAKKRV